MTRNHASRTLIHASSASLAVRGWGGALPVAEPVPVLPDLGPSHVDAGGTQQTHTRWDQKNVTHQEANGRQRASFTHGW